MTKFDLRPSKIQRPQAESFSTGGWASTPAGNTHPTSSGPAAPTVVGAQSAPLHEISTTRPRSLDFKGSVEKAHAVPSGPVQGLFGAFGSGVVVTSLCWYPDAEPLTTHS